MLRISLRCALVPSLLRASSRTSVAYALNFRSFVSTRGQISTGIRLFNESIVDVQINDKDDGETFVCDEEPHMLSPELGYGYFPLLLGQKMGRGKLEIVRKLGWGSNSSVWLARSLCRESYPPLFVALKVLTVDATAGVLRGFLGEVDALKAIKNTNPGHPGYQHCSYLYDVFVKKSYHGIHLCIVTDVFGENMQRIRRLQPGKRGIFSVKLTKRIIKQTLLALDYLHRECGWVHTDVKPDNILVRLKDMDESISRLLEEDPSETYEPRIEPDLSPDPIITVKSQPLPSSFSLDSCDIDICLVDFGHATPVEKHLLPSAQPTLLRAPEVILDYQWSAPIDIWSVGCLVFEYLVGVTLFQIYETPSVSFTDVYLQRIVELIGAFPPDFLEICPQRAQFFDEAGSLLRTNNFFPQTFEECLRNYNVLSENDINEAASFMRRCLIIDPRKRPSALELLDDKWLRDA